MRKSRKNFQKLSACVLSAAMAVTLAAPLSPLTVQAAGEEPVNLAIGATATANDFETNDYTAAKAIDGIRQQRRSEAAVTLGNKYKCRAGTEDSDS